MSKSIPYTPSQISASSLVRSHSLSIGILINAQLYIHI